MWARLEALKAWCSPSLPHLPSCIHEERKKKEEGEKREKKKGIMSVINSSLIF
jgi:hypothetical protein